MDVEVELKDAGPHQKTVTITVPQDRVDGRFQAAYRKLQGKVKIPGFRKGKAPRRLLKRHYREQVTRDVTAGLVAEEVGKVVAEHALDVVGEPEVDAGSGAAQGQPFRFSVALALRPDVSVSDYTGIRLASAPPSLGEDELDAHLESMRQQTGALETVEADRSARDGDVVDVTLTFQDPTYGDLVREHQMIRLPDDPDHPFAVDLVRNLRPGETAADEVEIPDDYHLPDWAGRRCKCAVLLHEIKRVSAPPLDDAFARRMGHDTVEQLREALRGQLLEVMAEREQGHRIRQLLEAIMARNPFEVPRPMVDERARTLVRSIAAQLTDGMSQASDPSLDDLDDEKRQQVLEEAEFSVRRELILEAIGEQEGIALEEGERAAGIERIAARAGQPAEVLESALGRGGMANFEAKLLEDKIIDWLLERAQVVEEG